MSANPYDSQEYIDYVRENINPAYKLSKKEALKYAASMGTSDTLRGVGQILGESFGIDALNEYLKEKDKKLSGILSNPEYGTEATAAFLSAGIKAFESAGAITIASTRNATISSTIATCLLRSLSSLMPLTISS